MSLNPCSPLGWLTMATKTEPNLSALPDELLLMIAEQTGSGALDALM